MNEIEIREYQLAQLPLIQEIDRVCEEYGLKYYLIGGTLLGAIRHGGFIPWDTDMDIALPRSDYEKLREYFINNPSDKFFYQHYTTEKNHLSPHAILKIKNTHITYNKTTNLKAQHDGLFLDIFPLDEPPSDEKLQLKQQKQIKRIKRIAELKAGYVYGKTGKLALVAKRAVQIILSPITLKFLHERLDKIMRRYNFGTSEFLVSMASHYSYKKQLMPKFVYGTPVRVNFEGLRLCAPNQIDDYLRRIFKDYMKLPPEEGRYDEINAIQQVIYENER